MTWDIPYRWGGPVLAWELRRTARHRWQWVLDFVFLTFCVAQLFMLYSSYMQHEAEERRTRQAAYVTPAGRPLRGPLDHLHADNQARLDFAARHLGRFFPQQLLFLLFITPAVTAGALGHEKERDTLTALFTTELADREIVTGKLLGRLWVLIKFMMVGAPVIFCVAGFARVDFLPLLICYLHAIVMTYALAGICMFCSVITRRTRDAIMACYSMIIILTLVSFLVIGDNPLPLWLNPAEVVIRLSTPPFLSITPQTFLLHLGSFLLIGWVFIRLSKWFLRPMALKQLEDRSARWKWAMRRDIGDDPVRWRERHILGLAPLQALRSMPTWLGWAGVFAFSVSFVLGLMNAAVHGRITYHLSRLEWNLLWRSLENVNLNTITSDVTLMGVLLIVFATLTVFFRCAGAVTEENRRKTWDDLVMTGLPVDRMVESKMWGIFQACTPYLFLYSIPMFAYAVLAGPPALLAALITFGLSWVFTLAAAMVGISMSLTERDRHEVRRPRALGMPSTSAIKSIYSH